MDPGTPRVSGILPEIDIAFPVWIQDCGSVFHRLLADFGQSKKCEGRLREERDAARKVSVEQKYALAAAQSEIARLSAELEKAKSAATDMKARFVEASKKHMETTG